MSVPFHPQQGLVMLHAAVDGPSGSAVLQLALDTGATETMINAGMLVALGYDPALAPERIQRSRFVGYCGRFRLHLGGLF